MLRFTLEKLTIDHIFTFGNQVLAISIFNIIHLSMKLQTPIFSATAIALTLSLGAIIPGVAQAATVTHTSAPISYDQDADPGVGPWATSSLPYFDAALGTLNSVYYQFLGEVSASVTYTNNSKKSNSVYASSFFNAYGYLNPNGKYYNNAPTPVEAFANFSVANTTIPGFGATFWSKTTRSFDSPLTAGNASHFIKTGSYDVGFGSYFLSYLSNFGASNFNFIATGEAINLVASVTYDYTPTDVPTPALLPGLIGLGFTAIRKRREKAAVA
jgi:hypothetical protein